MAKWNETLSNDFWKKRQLFTVLQDENFRERKHMLENDRNGRHDRKEKDKAMFSEKYKHCLQSSTTSTFGGENISNNLQFWIRHMSWTFCEKCHVLYGQKLLPNYIRQPPLKCYKTCKCSETIYTNPFYNTIHEVLKQLTQSDIYTLRPFEIHLGDYKRMQNGYRQKTNFTRLTWAKEDVLTKIEKGTDGIKKSRLLCAYRYLMSNENTSYRQFVFLRKEKLIRIQS